MKALTIRKVDPRLARALELETRRRGTSLNQTVLDVLSHALGVALSAPRTNGLARLAGTWTARDHAEFERATAVFERVDDELWK